MATMHMHIVKTKWEKIKDKMEGKQYYYIDILKKKQDFHILDL